MTEATGQAQFVTALACQNQLLTEQDFDNLSPLHDAMERIATTGKPPGDEE
jgi:hypothetical protein